MYNELLHSGQSLPAAEQAQLLANIGVLRRRLGDPQKALDTYREAQELYRRAAHRRGRISVLNNIGIVQAMDLGDFAAAARTFSDSLKLAEQSGSRPSAVHARLYRGEALYRAGRVDDSAADFRVAAEQAKELHEPEEEWKALYGLARTAESSADTARVTSYLEQAVNLIESLRANAVNPRCVRLFLRTSAA